MRPILKSEKLSLDECRKILSATGKKYSDSEIEKIRNWIYHIAQFTLDFLRTKSASEIHEIKKFLTKNVKNDSDRIL